MLMLAEGSALLEILSKTKLNIHRTYEKRNRQEIQFVYIIKFRKNYNKLQHIIEYLRLFVEINNTFSLCLNDSPCN